MHETETTHKEFQRLAGGHAPELTDNLPHLGPGLPSEPRRLSASNSPQQLAGAITEGSHYLLWVGVSEDQSIAGNTFLGVPIDLEDLSIWGSDASDQMSSATLDLLYHQLGDAFVARRENIWDVHQSVLIALFAAREASIPVEFYKWDAGSSEFFITRMAEANVDKVTVLVGYTSSCVLKDVELLYRTLHNIQDIAGYQLRVIPSQLEVAREEYKINDIRILDAIASQEHDTMFSFRPTTCYGIGVCRLPHDTTAMVLKRSHSSGGSHVRRYKPTDRNKLLCRASLPTPPKKYIRIQRSWAINSIHFHQECIPTLQSLGEYRVFVCKSDIISTAYTKPGADSRIAVKNATALAGNKPMLQTLHKFVRRIHSQLVAQPDAGVYLETVLLFGARYDCGMTDDGKLFVNEITRFYSADMFSAEVHGKPYTQTVKAYGDALGEELGKGRCGHASVSFDIRSQLFGPEAEN